MRLLVIGRLDGELAAASIIASRRGARVTLSESIDRGLPLLRTEPADLIMVEVAQPIATLVQALAAEQIDTPVVACGAGTDAPAAVAAVGAGARDYIPLSDPELLAGVIEALADPSRACVRSQDREPIAVPPTHPAFGAITSPDGEAIGAAHADAAFRSVQAPKDLTRGLVGRTVADVERDLILDTLGHCLGNRTHAAKILGISIRTLRNKLNEYGAAGAAVPESGQARIATAWDEAAVSPAFL